MVDFVYPPITVITLIALSVCPRRAQIVQNGLGHRIPVQMKEATADIFSNSTMPVEEEEKFNPASDAVMQSVSYTAPERGRCRHAGHS
ncbi:hypothetical protein KM043_007803 [Ampulex compressa]|nr:hypothetical protein KM043_007803 [Ampulex compressa]